MAIIVKTNNPSGLLKAIYKAIDDKKIETWAYDTDKDFTHVPDQWKNKAWLSPKIYTGELRLGIIGQKNTTMSKLIYGVYHGRFIEMLLTHFDRDFTTAIATAQVTEPDSI
jgi:hypothetical protein